MFLVCIVVGALVLVRKVDTVVDGGRIIVVVRGLRKENLARTESAPN